MKFCWATVTTDKLEESLQFYKEIVGLTTLRRFSPSDGAEIAFMTDGSGFELELLKNGGSKGMQKDGISLGFTVHSLADTLALVKSKGIAPFGGPVKVPGCAFFFVRDPNGVTLQFVENER